MKELGAKMVISRAERDVQAKLGLVSHLILVVLMYLGRVGGLTLIYAAISVKIQSGAKRPLDKITVG